MEGLPASCSATSFCEIQTLCSRLCRRWSTGQGLSPVQLFTCRCQELANLLPPGADPRPGGLLHWQQCLFSFFFLSPIFWMGPCSWSRDSNWSPRTLGEEEIPHRLHRVLPGPAAKTTDTAALTGLFLLPFPSPALAPLLVMPHGPGFRAPCPFSR